MAAEVVDLLVPHGQAFTADNSRDLEQNRTLLQRFILVRSQSALGCGDRTALEP